MKTASIGAVSAITLNHFKNSRFAGFIRPFDRLQPVWIATKQQITRTS
ncbi:MAG: hypothetical protein M0R69_06320 [Candidatus Cloacimonetes bacterium]|nr:hypothetical protein [Candidatus Cloacimonadota bacterium]